MLTDKEITVYIDGNCGYCVRSFKRISKVLDLRSLILKNAHVDPGREKEMFVHNSWIVVDAHGNSHYRYEGLLILIRASKRFRFCLKFLSLQPVKYIGETLYKHIARNRGVNK